MSVCSSRSRSTLEDLVLEPPSEWQGWKPACTLYADRTRHQQRNERSHTPELAPSVFPEAILAPLSKISQTSRRRSTTSMASSSSAPSRGSPSPDAKGELVTARPALILSM
ncbi:hypothetical protein DACRYDRAFT_23359 [Dacryopinax primogenitus]|uniref:Uncharacterized protein n=1 Tax=Dacryopinax primogenitus (strain DJM 731) TaxID=1858805 RepID=M5G9J4_DACPD|nr:uncharacterized protein DACRYDRAFT_23359 [Dacryopinax primogenitus]EJU00478.1 hypothetical protein DACRYDRAFT_23359 [Dacryopinax primogenitus]